MQPSPHTDMSDITGLTSQLRSDYKIVFQLTIPLTSMSMRVFLSRPLLADPVLSRAPTAEFWPEGKWLEIHQLRRGVYAFIRKGSSCFMDTIIYVQLYKSHSD